MEHLELKEKWEPMIKSVGWIIPENLWIFER
jgi:hypothetical protein